MIKNIIGILSVVLLLASCSHEVFIDNPLKEDLKVYIEGKEILIEGESFKKMKLSQGLNQVVSVSGSGDTLLNEKIDISDLGLLNITNSTYAIWKDVYCEEEDYEDFKKKLNITDTVIIDGLEFVDLDLELIKNLFIVKKWNLGLDKEMPETVEIEENEKYKIVSKLYRAIELKEAFNYYGDYDFKDLSEEEINKVLNNVENN